MKTLKSTLVLLAIICTILTMQSCKDECDDGLCDCPIGYTGVNCVSFDSDEVQVLLDEGITPLELIEGNVPLSKFDGKMYEGGLIFYVNGTDGSGLVAATEDQSEGAAWGCPNEGITGADSEAIGTGVQNTTDILMDCSTNGIAAKLCDELVLNSRTDWFLPSKDELNLMFINLADSDGDGINSGPNDSGNLGGFTGAFYWSSTESNDSRAWYQFFTNNGAQNDDFKTNLNYVRAIRAF